MTHTYQHYATACICGKQPEHHVHTGTFETCPCDDCGLARENAEFFQSIFRRLAEELLPARRTPYELVPATFKPQEQQ